MIITIGRPGEECPTRVYELSDCWIIDVAPEQVAFSDEPTDEQRAAMKRAGCTTEAP